MNPTPKPWDSIGRRALRAELVAEQGGLCAYCDCVMTPEGQTGWTIDHVIAINIGGTHDRSNLVAACSRCNKAKSNWTAAEMRKVAARIDAITAARSLAAERESA